MVSHSVEHFEHFGDLSISPPYPSIPYYDFETQHEIHGN